MTVLNAWRNGASLTTAAELIGVTHSTVYSHVRGSGGLRQRPRKGRSPRQLSLAERETISRGVAVGLSNTKIARELGRWPSTITREINNNGGRAAYRAVEAEARTERLAARPKAAKLVVQPALAAVVSEWLNNWWSPQQIAVRLVREFPDDETMRISHEAIYQSLYVQGRGALRRELAACLRTGRAYRIPRAQQARRRRNDRGISGLVPISERHAEADDRAVPGHWEGDLIVGGRKAAIATLVERTTRFVLLIALPNGHRAEQLTPLLSQAIGRLPEQLRRSLTWDRGREMASHAAFTVATDVPVYFCDPHAPWQRGSNENTNGLLRQYFPKGTDLTGITQAHLDDVAASLNRRPRQTLDWRTPSEALEQLLGAATG